MLMPLLAGDSVIKLLGDVLNKSFTKDLGLLWILKGLGLLLQGHKIS
jgi:hypothetical protein